ncbi:unnamed protein product [Strongylus vulgaris]|uniref:Uncharacterized protein n=1 Tax=Strongylus vulgaris TaxID=40348 RepID=A0A3P7IT43_STRVU|nr:unnamed protein product [Strongylus vulgaris]
MQDAIKIHYRCMHLFNLPKVICDPFRRQYDYNRCIKFLFDCELISEWGSEEELTGKSLEGKAEGGEEEQKTIKTLKPTPEDEKLAAKIAEEEKELENLLREKDKEGKKPEVIAPPTIAENVTSAVPVVPQTSQKSELELLPSATITGNEPSVVPAILNTPKKTELGPVPTPTIANNITSVVLPAIVNIPQVENKLVAPPKIAETVTSIVPVVTNSSQTPIATEKTKKETPLASSHPFSAVKLSVIKS